MVIKMAIDSLPRYERDRASEELHAGCESGFLLRDEELEEQGEKQSLLCGKSARKSSCTWRVKARSPLLQNNPPNARRIMVCASSFTCIIVLAIIIFRANTIMWHFYHVCAVYGHYEWLTSSCKTLSTSSCPDGIINADASGSCLSGLLLRVPDNQVEIETIPTDRKLQMEHPEIAAYKSTMETYARGDLCGMYSEVRFYARSSETQEAIRDAQVGSKPFATSSAASSSKMHVKRWSHFQRRGGLFHRIKAVVAENGAQCLNNDFVDKPELMDSQYNSNDYSGFESSNSRPKYLVQYDQSSASEGVYANLYPLASLGKAFVSFAVLRTMQLTGPKAWNPEKTLYDMGNPLGWFPVSADASKQVLIVDGAGEQIATSVAGAAARNITIKQLLTHTSGITYHLSAGKNCLTGEEPCDAYQLAFEPGTAFAYSMGHRILAYLLEDFWSKEFRIYDDAQVDSNTDWRTFWEKRRQSWQEPAEYDPEAALLYFGGEPPPSTSREKIGVIATLNWLVYHPLKVFSLHMDPRVESILGVNEPADAGLSISVADLRVVTETLLFKGEMPRPTPFSQTSDSSASDPHNVGLKVKLITSRNWVRWAEYPAYYSDDASRLPCFKSLQYPQWKDVKEKEVQKLKDSALKRGLNLPSFIDVKVDDLVAAIMSHDAGSEDWSLLMPTIYGKEQQEPYHTAKKEGTADERTERVIPRQCAFQWCGFFGSCFLVDYCRGATLLLVRLSWTWARDDSVWRTTTAPNFRKMENDVYSAWKRE